MRRLAGPGHDRKLRLTPAGPCPSSESRCPVDKARWADFIDRSPIDTAELARRRDRRVVVDAIDHIEAEQLLFGLGKRAVEHDARARAAQVWALRVASSRAAGPS